MLAFTVHSSWGGCVAVQDYHSWDRPDASWPNVLQPSLALLCHHVLTHISCI